MVDAAAAHGTDAAAGRGAVLVRDPSGLACVLFRLAPELVRDPGFQRDYPREVAVLAGLTGAEVAAPRSCVTDDAGKVVASVRRRVEGVALGELLAARPRGLDVLSATVLARDVLRGVRLLHARGVAHRAVVPERVIVQPDGVCVLVDAGLVPRGEPDDLFAALSGDIRGAAELFALCVRLSNPLSRPAPDAWADPFQPAPEAFPRRIYAALSAQRPALRWTEDWVGALLAPLDELEAAAQACFDADWDGRGRDRLASAVQSQLWTRSRHRGAHAAHAGGEAAGPGAATRLKAGSGPGSRRRARRGRAADRPDPVHEWLAARVGPALVEEEDADSLRARVRRAFDHRATRFALPVAALALGIGVVLLTHMAAGSGAQPRPVGGRQPAPPFPGLTGSLTAMPAPSNGPTFIVPVAHAQSPQPTITPGGPVSTPSTTSASPKPVFSFTVPPGGGGWGGPGGGYGGPGGGGGPGGR